MALDRHQQVAGIWDWLPAFRAAAEYESLQRAGLAMAVSPSALSRSVKLLEESLGLTLFTRSPSGLTLTASGRRLLDATRDAMRRIHHAMPEPALCRLRAGAVGPALPGLLSEAALDGLSDWALSFVTVPFSEAGERLRCGDLDVVLTHEALPGPQLQVEALPPLQWVLAVGADGARSRVASPDAAGFAWPEASVTATGVEQVVALAERLKIAVFAPLYAVPVGWIVLERPPPRPVFLATREYSTEPPPFRALICEALISRLTPR